MPSKSPQERMIVVPYRPGLKLRQRLTAWLAVLIGMAGGFVIGAAAFYLRYQEFTEEHEKMRIALEESQAQEALLRQQVTNYERGRAIDQQAALDVQKTIMDLHKTIARLKEDTTFYKNILAPSEQNKGLKVQRWEVEPIRDRRYRYKLVLAQIAENKNFVEGIAAVNFIGTKGRGEQEIIPLRDMTGTRDLGVRFKFRYFQELTGELLLPDDFRPDKVQVVVQSKGRNATKLEQTFLWKLEEPKTDVGKEEA